MGVYIPNIEMPKSCGGCDLSYIDSEWGDFWCVPLVEDVTKIKGILPNCPLIEIPTPHGRLIDADKVFCYNFWDEQNIDNAPTILEAEE